MIDVNSVLDKIDSLPPLPATSVKIMSLLGDPEASFADIIEVIKYDQALTSEVLRLCNSAYFGLSRQITSLNDAMVCLGTLKILQLVMTVHSNGVLDARQEGYGLESGMLWRQSVATAFAASEFARLTHFPNANLAFTAGLLHGIGKLVLNRFVAGKSTEILRLVDEEKRSFIEAEQEVLGVSHSDVGAAAAERWKLPESIVQSIKYQYNPGALDPSVPLVDIVHLANCVTLMMGISLGDDGLSYHADEAVLERHNLGHSDLEIVGMNMCSELQRLAELDESASKPAKACS